jgi:hypothetical protein
MVRLAAPATVFATVLCTSSTSDSRSSGVYRLPFVETPYIINAAQFDSFAMLYDLGGEPPSTPSQVQFADNFQALTRNALQIAVQRGMAVFSSTCLVHCLTSDTQLYKGITVNGASFMDSATAWLAGSTPVDVGGCNGYSCVAECPDGGSIAGISEAEAAANAPPVASDQDGVWVSRNSQMMGVGGGVAPGGTGTGVAQSWMSAGRRVLRRRLQALLSL